MKQAVAVPRLLLIALPFLATIGALYWVFLRTYDINYYLTQKPPEFLAAVGSGVDGEDAFDEVYGKTLKELNRDLQEELVSRAEHSLSH